MEAYQNVIDNFRGQLNALETQDLDIYIKTEEAATICNQILVQLQDLVLGQGFKSEDNEIEFFKFIKPKVVSKLIYHFEYFNIQYKWPKGLKKLQIKYLNEQIARLQKYYKSNMEFYHYYLKKETDLDDLYFLRKNKKVRLNIGSYHFFTDYNFSTNHDNTMATILAYEKLIKKLHDDIETLIANNMDTTTTSKAFQKETNLRWTGSFTDLVEIAYAFQTSGCVNNGNASRIEIYQALQEIFNGPKGDIYGACNDIRGRKTSPTIFLDFLTTMLKKSIHELDKIKNN